MIIIVSQSVADKQIVCIAQPATAGRHRRSGARQSIPSISIDSCSELSASVSPGSTSGGHRNTPCSSRLVNRHRPVPSQYTILIRLALRPRNTKRWPLQQYHQFPKPFCQRRAPSRAHLSTVHGTLDVQLPAVETPLSGTLSGIRTGSLGAGSVGVGVGLGTTTGLGIVSGISMGSEPG